MSNPSNSTEKAKSCRTPRREVRWLDLGSRNRTLESIKRRFQDRLDRFLSSSNSLLRRISSPMNSKLRHNLHQCPGYLREEITLASDVSKSVIVSHAFPSQSEICSICGQLVQYNRTEPSFVDGENTASLSPLSSSMEDASNISEIEPETYEYSASHSGSPTQSWTLDKENSVSSQWEATLIHHVNNESDYAAEVINCICGFDMDDGFAIACDLCSRWCHAVCFDIASEEIPDQFMCWMCKPRPLGFKERAIRMQKERLKLEAEAIAERQRKASPSVERYVHISQDIVSDDTQVKLRRQTQHWRGVTAVADSSPLLSPAKPSSYFNSHFGSEFGS